MNVHAGYMSVIKNATGEFLSIVATDDVLVNEKTEKQVEALANLGDEYGVVYGDVIEIDANGKILKEPNFVLRKKNNPKWNLPHGDIFYTIIGDWVFYVQASLFRINVLEEFYYPENYISEDRYFILYATRNTKVLGAEDVCVLYRIREGSISNLATKNENYHLWALSDVRMYLEIAQFSEFSKKKLIALNKKIQEQILRYAYHKDANYMIAVKEWYRSLSLPKSRNQLHTFFYINWFFFRKILISKNKL
jgi:predicted RNA-binding protein